MATSNPPSHPRKEPTLKNDFDAACALNYIGDRLADPQVEAFFSSNRHKQSATRGLLDLLGVPLPGWAQRSLSGRAAVTKAAIDRFREDHPAQGQRPSRAASEGR